MPENEAAIGVVEGDHGHPPPLSLDETQTSPYVQEGVARKNLQEAKVTYLDGSTQIFHVHKNADGEILFNMVAAQLNLIEKDYFALSFYNEQNIRLWLYKEKKISKQLKGRPWEFEFIVKFYPPEPDQLVEDFTRHLMVLQLRHDVYTEKLPFVFEKLAILGSYVAQSELGDYQPHEQYDDYLRQAKIAPIVTDDLIRRVRDLHRDIQKGQTKSEAEFKYLELCAKGHHLYGVWKFDAKDNKGNPVHVGVSAHGIGIYGDHANPRLHMFAWQDIIKIAYRRNIFSIKLKEGVLDSKKEVIVNYRLGDYPAAKRLWKCGVEHHTFFRLVQAEPDIKPKHGLFRWGSSRFRYSGRTQLQTRMASNSYANSPGSTMQRTDSGRVVSRSVDDIAQKQHASPLKYADDPTQSKDLISSPEKSYPISEIESDKKKKKKDKRKAEEAAEKVGLAHPTVSKQKPTTTTPPTQKSSSSLLLHDHTSPVQKNTYQRSYYIANTHSPPSHTATTSSTTTTYYSSSLEKSISPYDYSNSESQFSPYSSTHVTNGTGGSSSTTTRETRVKFIDEVSPESKPKRARRNLFGRFSPTKSKNLPLAILKNENEDYVLREQLDKSPEVENIPIEEKVTVYDSGVYATPKEKMSAKVFLKKKRVPTSDRLLKNSNIMKNATFDASTIGNLEKSDEFIHLPIRYYSSVYHSGHPKESLTWNKRVHLFNTLRSDEDYVEKGNLVAANYIFDKNPCYEHARLEKVDEFETVPIKAYVRKIRREKTPENAKMTRGFIRFSRQRRRGSVESISDSDNDEKSKKSEKKGARLHVHVRPIMSPKSPTSEPESSGQKIEKIGWRLRKRHEKEEDLPYIPPIDYLKSEPYTGNYEILDKSGNLESIPLRNHVNPYHSGYTSYRKKIFERVKYELTDEIVEISQYTYKFSTPTSEEDSEKIFSKTEELENLPLREFSRVYHPGKSWKNRKIVKISEVPSDESSTSDDEASPKKSKIAFLRSKKRPTTSEDSQDTSLGDRLRNFIRISWRSDSAYESQPSPSASPVETQRSEDVSTPMETQERPVSSRSEKNPSLLLCLKTQKNEEGVQENAQKIKYTLNTAKYEGPIVDLGKESEIEAQPLKDTCEIPKEYCMKKSLRPSIFKKTHAETQEDAELANETETQKIGLKCWKTHELPEEEEEEGHELSKTAKIFIRSAKKEAIPYAYPVSEPYEGKLEPMGVTEELDAYPLHSYIDKTSSEKVEKIEIEHTPEVETTPILVYNFDRTPYEGPMEDLEKKDELETQKLEDFAAKPSFETMPDHQNQEILKNRFGFLKKIGFRGKPEENGEDNVEKREKIKIFKKSSDENETTAEQTSYNFSKEKYEGPYENLSKNFELELENLEKFVEKREYPMKDDSPTKKTLRIFEKLTKKSAQEIENSEPVNENLDEKRDSHVENDSPTKKKHRFFGKLTRKSIPDVKKSPPEDKNGEKLSSPTKQSTKKTAKLILKHEKIISEEEEAAFFNTPYDFSTEPYVGPLENLAKNDDLSKEKIENYVDTVPKIEKSASKFGFLQKISHLGKSNGGEIDEKTKKLQKLHTETHSIGEKFEGEVENLGKAFEIQHESLENRPSEVPCHVKISSEVFSESTPEEKSTLSYVLDTQPYEGPLENLTKTTEIEVLSLEGHEKPRVYESPSKERHGFGLLEKISRVRKSLEVQEIGPEVEKLKKSKKIKYETHSIDQEENKNLDLEKEMEPSNVEKIDEKTIEKQHYQFDTSPYEGQLENLAKNPEIEGLPIQNLVENPPKMAEKHQIFGLLQKIKAGKKVSEEKTEVSEVQSKKTARIFVKTAQKSHDEKISGYPTTSEPYEGPIEKVEKIEEIAEIPIEKCVFSEAEAPDLGKYPISEPYSGPLDDLFFKNDISSSEIAGLCEIKHPGYYEKVEKIDESTKNLKKEGRLSQKIAKFFQKSPEISSPKLEVPEIVIESDVPLEKIEKNPELEQYPIENFVEKVEISETPEEEKTEIADKKRKIRLHLKKKSSEKSSHDLFSCLQTGRKQDASEKSPSETDFQAYPTSTPYEGPYSEVKKSPELVAQPIKSHVAVYHKGESDRKLQTVIRNSRVLNINLPNLHIFTKPPLYDFDSTPHVGQLGSVYRNEELENIPIKESVAIYHPGYEKSKRGKKLRAYIPGRTEKASKLRKIPQVQAKNDDFPVDLEKIPDLENLPLRKQVKVYHSGQISTHRIEKEKIQGHEEIGEINPNMYPYGLKITYETECESLAPKNELDIYPIREYSNIYYQSIEKLPLRKKFRFSKLKFFQKQEVNKSNIAPGGSKIEEKESKFKKTMRIHLKRKHPDENGEILAEEPITKRLEIDETGTEKPREAEISFVSYLTPMKNTENVELLKENVNWECENLEKADELGRIPLENVYQTPKKIEETVETLTEHAKKRENIYGFSEEHYSGPLENLEKYSEIGLHPLANMCQQPTEWEIPKIDVLAQKPEEKSSEKAKKRDNIYGFSHELYSGSLEVLGKQSEIDSHPLSDQCQLPKTYEYSITGLKTIEKLETPSKKTAILHLKSSRKTEIDPETPKSSGFRLKFPSFFRTNFYGEKGKNINLLDYPQKSEVYTGPMPEISPFSDLPYAKIRENVQIYHSGYSSVATNPDLHEKIDGEEDVENNPELDDYGPLRLPFDGPMAKISTHDELDHIPLRSVSKIYYQPKETVEKSTETFVLISRNNHHEINEENLENRREILQNGHPSTSTASHEVIGHENVGVYTWIGQKLRRKHEKVKEKPKFDVSEYKGPLEKLAPKNEIEEITLEKHVPEWKSKSEARGSSKKSNFRDTKSAPGIKTYRKLLIRVKSPRKNRSETTYTENFGTKLDAEVQEIAPKTEIEATPLEGFARVDSTDATKYQKTHIFKSEHEETGQKLIDTTPYVGPIDEIARKSELEGYPIEENVEKLGATPIATPQESIFARYKKLFLRTRPDDHLAEPRTDIKSKKKMRIHMKKRKQTPGEEIFEEEEIDVPFDLSAYPTTYTYSDTYLELLKHPEMENQGLRSIVSVYHSGFTDYRSFFYYLHNKFQIFEREKIVGNEDKSTESVVSMDKSTEFDGNLMELTKENELETKNLREFVENSPKKIKDFRGEKAKKKSKKNRFFVSRKTSLESISSRSSKEEEKEETRIVKKRVVFKKKPSFYPEKAQKTSHESETPTLEKEKPSKSSKISCLPLKSEYDFSSGPYFGPYESVAYISDLEKSDLEARPVKFSMEESAFHSPEESKKGYFMKIRTLSARKSDTKSDYGHSREVYSGPLEDIGYTQDLEKIDLVAKPFVETMPEIHPSSENGQKTSILEKFGLKIRKSIQKTEESEPTAYNFDSKPYEGPLETVGYAPELENVDLETRPTIETMPETQPSLERISENRTFSKYILKIRKSTTKTEETELPEPVSIYNFDSTPYEDPLETMGYTSELEKIVLDTKPTQETMPEISVFSKFASKIRKSSISTPTEPALTYNFDSTPYEGPLETIGYNSELEKIVLDAKPSQETMPEISTFSKFASKIRKSSISTSPEPALTYNFDTTPYEGQLETVEYIQDMLKADLDARPSQETMPETSIFTKITSKIRRPSTSTDEIPISGYDFSREAYTGPLEYIIHESGLEKIELGTRPVQETMPETSEIEADFKKLDMFHMKIKEKTHTDYPGVSEKYEGPLEIVRKTEEIEPIQLEISKPKTSEGSPETPENDSSFESPEKDFKNLEMFHKGIKEKRVSTDGYPLKSEIYEGPLEKIEKTDELSSLPLEISAKTFAEDVKLEESPEKDYKKLDLFNLKLTKKRVSTDKYPLKSEFYEGPLRTVEKTPEIDHSPLENTPKFVEKVEEKLEKLEKPKKTALLYLKNRSKTENFAETYPSITETYAGPLETVEKTPEIDHSSLEHRPKFEKMEEKIEKSEKIKCLPLKNRTKNENLTETYPKISDIYTGPLENFEKTLEIEHTLLEKRPEVEEKGEKSEKIAIFHLKTKSKNTNLAENYPIQSDQYVGPLEIVEKTPEIEHTLLENRPKILAIEEKSKKSHTINCLHLKNKPENEEKYEKIDKVPEKSKKTALLHLKIRSKNGDFTETYPMVAEIEENPREKIENLTRIELFPQDLSIEAVETLKKLKEAHEKTGENQNLDKLQLKIREKGVENEEKSARKEKIDKKSITLIEYTYPTRSEPYSGPLEEISYTNELGSTQIDFPIAKISEKPQKMDLKCLNLRSRSPETPYGYPQNKKLYEGKMEEVEYEKDIEKCDLGFEKWKNNEPQDEKWEKIASENEEKVVYTFDTTPYDGPYETIAQNPEFSGVPLENRPHIPLEIEPDISSSQKSKKTAILYLKKPRFFEKSQKLTRPEIEPVLACELTAKPEKSQKTDKAHVSPYPINPYLQWNVYKGPLESTEFTEDIPTLPLEARPSVADDNSAKNRKNNRLEEWFYRIVPRKTTNLSKYPRSETSFEGEYEKMEVENELQTLPLEARPRKVLAKDSVRIAKSKKKAASHLKWPKKSSTSKATPPVSIQGVGKKRFYVTFF